jgi:hypothetical protein
MQLAAALLLLGSVATGPDVVTVTLRDGTVMRGEVLACSNSEARFAPQSGGHELLLSRESVREMRVDDGTAVCWSRAPQPSRWGTGILSFVVLPLAGTLVGGAVGGAACSGGDDTSVCAGLGSLIGLGAGLVTGTTLFVLSGRDPSPPAPVPAPARVAGVNPAVSFALRF